MQRLYWLLISLSHVEQYSEGEGWFLIQKKWHTNHQPWLLRIKIQMQGMQSVEVNQAFKLFNYSTVKFIISWPDPICWIRYGRQIPVISNLSRNSWWRGLCACNRRVARDPNITQVAQVEIVLFLMNWLHVCKSTQVSFSFHTSFNLCRLSIQNNNNNKNHFKMHQKQQHNFNGFLCIWCYKSVFESLHFEQLASHCFDFAGLAWACVCVCALQVVSLTNRVHSKVIWYAFNAVHLCVLPTDET